jgi:hypothetical protein
LGRADNTGALQCFYRVVSAVHGVAHDRSTIIMLVCLLHRMMTGTPPVHRRSCRLRQAFILSVRACSGLATVRIYCWNVLLYSFGNEAMLETLLSTM